MNRFSILSDHRAAVVCIGLLLWTPACCWAQLPVAELHWLSRQAAQVGQSWELSVQGSQLEELNFLQVNDLRGGSVDVEAQAKFAAPQPLRDWQESSGAFQLKCGSDVRCGLIEIRTVGRFGASNPRSFVLCDRPVVRTSTDHNSLLTALAPEFGHIVNSHTQPLQSHYYRFTLGSGRALQCVAYSKQIDSPADLSLRLLNSQGRELAAARGLWLWPAEMSWKNSSDQPVELFIEVRDLLGRGGPQFAYLLECVNDMGSQQLTSSDSAPHLQPSEGQDQALHLNQLLRPSLQLPVDPSRCLLTASAAFSGTLATPGESTEPSQVEAKNAEPQSMESLAGTALTLESLPILIQGDLHSARTIDFSAKQGQTLVFDVSSAKLGQLTDPVLVIFKREAVQENHPENEKWRWIGDSDDAPYVGTAAMRIRQLDPSWLWTAPEDGLYRLRIADNQSGHRPADSLGFILEIRQPQPSFSLVCYRANPSNDPAVSKPLGNQLMRWGTDRLHVTALRRDGFNGPIELRVNGLPESCECRPVILQAGASEATLVIHASDAIVEGSCKLQVVGRSAVGENTAEIAATYATIIAAAAPTYNTVLSRRTGLIEAATSTADLAPLQVACGDSSLMEAKPDSKLTVTLHVRRGEGGAGECTFRPHDLPPKVSLGEVKVAPDQSQVTAELAIAADAMPGEYTFWWLAESKVQWRANPQSLVREQEHLKKLQSSLELLVRMEQNQPPEATSDSSPIALAEKSQYQSLLDAGLSKEKLEAAIATATARVEQLTSLAAAKEITVWLPTNPVRLRIVQ